MRSAILEFSDYNMAGYEWSWTFYLNKTADKRFTVSCRQIVKEDSTLRIPARRGLSDGVEVYEALDELVAEAGYSLSDHELDEIGKKVGDVDVMIVSDFLNGNAIVAKRAEEAALQLAEMRAELLAPYRKCIQEFVSRFSDSPGQYGPSSRAAATRFIEEYIMTHDYLPDGVHTIRLSGPMSYAGGQHDFSDLTRIFQSEQQG